MASVFYHGIFDTKQIKLPLKVYRKSDLSHEELHNKVLLLISDSDLVCKNVEYCARQYSVNDLVVLKCEDRDSLEVGLVKIIVFRRGKVHLIIKRYKVLSSELGIYQNLTENSDLKVEDVSIEALHDSYPLHMKGTERRFVLVAHHHVTCCYT